MPLIDVERYDDDIVPFLDVAVCDDNESVIGSHSVSLRSSSSEIPRVISSMPSDVVTTITNLEEPSDSDDDLSFTHSVRTNKSNSQLQTVSIRSRRFFSSIVSLDESRGDKLLSSKNSRDARNRFDLTNKCDSGCCEVSEDDDRVSYLEDEVARLNAELTTSQSDHALAKVESRQIAVELEDLRAFCERLQEQNQKLQEENTSLRRGASRRWFGLQPLKLETADSVQHVRDDKIKTGTDKDESTEEDTVDSSKQCDESLPEGKDHTELEAKDEKKSWWGFGAPKRQPTEEATLPTADEESEGETA